jgi:hypothetical protein
MEILYICNVVIRVRARARARYLICKVRVTFIHKKNTEMPPGLCFGFVFGYELRVIYNPNSIFNQNSNIILTLPLAVVCASPISKHNLK